METSIRQANDKLDELLGSERVLNIAVSHEPDTFGCIMISTATRVISVGQGIHGEWNVEEV